MNETIFHISAVVILFICVGISAYHCRKADGASDEKMSCNVDGTAMMTTIKIGGLALWLSPLVYLITPNWMVWSKISLPGWVRLMGIGVGIICAGLVYRLFNSIGTGSTPTSATRKEHKLVTSGPYRWVRHPLYTVGSAIFISFGLIASNWFIAILGMMTFIVMAIRTPKEEANLIEKFGDEYREYMKTTGAFFPKFYSGLL